MRAMIPLLLLVPFLSASEITMPKQQKFYISGIEFDTKIYCADFNKVIQEQAQKIKMLESEIAQLRKQQQERLSKTLKHEHHKELKEPKRTNRISDSKNKIIISDKPIQ